MRIGSLFSGYGGLDMGVQAVLGGDVVWNVEYDTAPSRILEHHWPGVPNYGDVTTLDWATVEPIDALTAGYPCQPFSQAGKRKGSTDARHLWPYVIDAIRHLRPELVVLENVRGHLTLGFDRVLGDLAEAGYDAEWICIPASAAGAPHKRDRIFVIAHPSSARRGGREDAGAGRSHEEADGGGGLESERGRLLEAWGEKAAAIDRWQRVIGRPVPAPAVHGRLTPEFVEWMMGLPAGHVTDVAITRTEQLKALGNGVVPQQAALALSVLMSQNSQPNGDDRG